MFGNIETLIADITSWFTRLFTIIQEFLTDIGVSK